jgi:DNA-binding CsgD family transcriptional regulator
VQDLEWRLRCHSDLLERLPLGVLLVDENRQVRHANRKAADLIQSGAPLRIREGHLTSDQPKVSGRMREILSAAIAFRDGRAPDLPSATVVSRPDGMYTTSVVVVPVSRETPLFADPSIALAVFVSDARDSVKISRDRLETRYELTPSEARLTVELARGHELKEAARHAGITHETARGYLKNVFRKTGTQRQPDLIARLVSDTALAMADSDADERQYREVSEGGNAHAR